MKRTVTTPEAILGGAIAQALIARGDHAKGAFDRLLPEGVDPKGFKHDEKAAQGLVVVAMLALNAARVAIDVVESGTLDQPKAPPEPGDEWKQEPGE